VKRLFQFCLSVFQNFGDDDCFSFAAAIAYWAFFSIFPFVLLVMGILSITINAPQQREAAVNAVYSMLGGSVGEEVLRSQVDSLARGAGQAGFIALLLAMWSASSMFSAVRSGMAAVWGKKSRQSLVTGKAMDLAMVLLVGLMLIASIAATAALTAFVQLSSRLIGHPAGAFTNSLIAIGTVLLPGAISFLAFMIIYRVTPRMPMRFSQVWIGALVAAVLFQAVQIGFATYVSHFANYQKVYGSLGAIIALLTFMYFSAAILLLGAEITRASMPERIPSEVEVGVPAAVNVR
jgi:membrane protein